MAETSGTRLPVDFPGAVRYFSDQEVANEYVTSLRWPGGRVCPHCGSAEHSYISTRRLWKCRACKRQFSIKVGTVFEGSSLGFDKWLPAVWAAANPEHAVSTRELARALGVTQRSAWFMLRRIRLARGEQS
jgi:transposase-like protein